MQARSTNLLLIFMLVRIKEKENNMQLPINQEELLVFMLEHNVKKKLLYDFIESRMLDQQLADKPSDNEFHLIYDEYYKWVQYVLLHMTENVVVNTFRQNHFGIQDLFYTIHLGQMCIAEFDADSAHRHHTTIKQIMKTIQELEIGIAQ